MAYTIPSGSHAVSDTGHTPDHNNIADMLTLLSAYNVKNTAYGAKGDGVTDDTAAIQAALDAASASAGIVVIPASPSGYVVSNLTIDSKVTLAAAGPAGPLIAKSGSSGFMITLKHPATTSQVTIRDLALQPSTGTLGGIYLDNTGFGTNDSQHTLRNIFVTSSGGDAFKFGANIRSMSVIGCQSYYSEGYGFNLQAGTTDSFFTNCVSGQSVNHGFYVNDGNNMLTACKAFYAGFDHNAGTWGTTQAGFYLNAVSRTALTGCTAEQAALHGFDLQSLTYCTVTGNAANNNSAGNGVTTGVGINMSGCQNCTVSCNSGNNNGSLSPGTQKYGYQVAGTQTSTLVYGNSVSGSSGVFNYVSGGGTLVIDSSGAQFDSSTLTAPAIQYSVNSPVALSSSSTITPTTSPPYGIQPVTETGNVTGIILAASSHNGQTVTLLNRSNFTITFAASGTSNVADGTSDIIPALAARTFIWDSGTSLWYRCG